ncbi:tyrosine-type recombinase/integrase [Helicobacter trogontum]
MYSVCDRIKYNILFKKHDVKHHESIHKQELKEILITLNKAFNNIESAYKYYKKLDYNLIPLMYKFNIYVPLRVKNIINLEWNEVDFNNKMLVIPDSKMKRGKEFKLPLNTQALAILEFMYKQKLDKYVFSLALSDNVRYKRALYNALCEYKELKDNGKWYHGVIKDLFDKL